MAPFLNFIGAAGGAGLWTPAALGSDYLIDHDMSLLTGSDNTDLSANIPDQSGNDYQGKLTGIDAPLLQTAELNGLNVIQFKTTSFNNHYTIALAGGADSQPFSGKTAGCCFFLLKHSADPPSVGQELTIQTAGAASEILWNNGDYFTGFMSTAQKNAGNPTPAMTSWRLMSFHSGASDYRVYIDGTLQFSTATNTFSGSNNIQVGIGGGPTSFRTGMLARALWCNTVLVTADRQKVEGSIMHKYALNGQLPGGHPYVSDPPLL